MDITQFHRLLNKQITKHLSADCLELEQIQNFIKPLIFHIIALKEIKIYLNILLNLMKMNMLK